MILFLDKNYLDEAVLRRRKFLSQCLLTVPTHIDQFEPYPHKGKVEDVKYRFLWKQIKSDVGFLQDVSLRLTPDVEKLPGCLPDKVHNEPFESERFQNNSLTECINFNLCDDVIPSSNPESPDLQFSTDDDIHGSNMFCDVFKKENLQLFSAPNDSLKIETRIDYTETQTNQVPTLSKLVARLTPMVTTDPLINKDGQAIKENNIFRALQLSSLDESHPTENQLVLDLHAIDDKVEKQNISNPLQLKEIEEMITDTVELPKKEPVYLGLTQTLGTNLKSLEPEPNVKDQPLKEDLKNRVVKEVKDVSDNIVPYKVESSDDEEITFLDINEPIVTEIDRLCEDAVLDTPLCASPEYHPDLDLPKCDTIELSPYTPKLLDLQKKGCLNKMCFSPEMYCDEIQTNRLAEPYNLEAETESIIPERHIEQVKLVAELGGQSTAADDLQLSWDIVKITALVNDPTHSFEKLDTDKTEMVVSDVTETFTKSHQDDFIDVLWSDGCDEENVETIDHAAAVQEDNLLTHDEVDEGHFFQQLTPIDIDYDGEPTVGIPTQKLPVNENITERQANFVKQTVNNDGKLPKTADIGFDPLGDFMALRSKKKEPVLQREMALPVHETQICDKPDALPVEKGLKQDDSLSLKQVAANRKKTKHHLVTVRLSDSYEGLVLVLEKAASNHLAVLKTSNDITRSCSFRTLSPDITRFLIKQREKYQLDNTVKDTEDSTYRDIVCVHGLVGAADIITNCCLESAIVFLNAIQEKYKDVIQDSLASVHQKLFQLKAELSHQQIFHPKMSALCKEIEVWLKKKRAKSGDNEQKILVIVKQNLPSLMNTLKKVLSLSKLLQPEIAVNVESDALIESLDVHNCLILHSHLIKDTFLWAQFSLVVEYASQDNSAWKEYCERQNIRHMSLIIEHQTKQDPSVDGDWNSQHRDKQISMVASQCVTGYSTLLQLLEARFNIQLYERDYTLLDGCKGKSYSDLDIDENTAIIMENIAHLREDRTLHNVVTRIVALSLKYTTCFCLLYTSDKTISTGYQFPSKVIVNLSRLQTAILNFGSRSKTSYKAKILVCPDVRELAAMIRKISEDVLISDTDRSTEHCLDRAWLTTDFTLAEKILLQSPCISSYNAQLVLKTIGINGCMKSSIDQLCEAVPGISKTTLIKFYDSIHQQHHKKRLQECPKSPQHLHTNHNTFSDKDEELTRIGKNPTSDMSSNIHVDRTISSDILNLPKLRSVTSKHDSQYYREALAERNTACESKHVREGKRQEELESKDFTPISSTSVMCNNGSEIRTLPQDLNSQMVQNKTRRTNESDPPNNHQQSRLSRNTPVRRLEFGNRSLTKPEESFRKLYGTKEYDRIRTPHKKQLQQNKPDNISINDTMQLCRPDPLPDDNVNIQSSKSSPNQLFSADEINLQQYRHDWLPTKKLNQQQYRSDQFHTDLVGLQQYRSYQFPANEGNLQQFRSDNPQSEEINLLQHDPNNTLTNKVNLLNHRPDLLPTEKVSLQQCRTEWVPNEKISQQQYGSDQFQIENASLQQYRHNQIKTEKNNMQLYRPNEIITENASLQQYRANKIITENASLQQYGPNQIITENASLQQYRPNQIITENASLQQYGPNQKITENASLQQYGPNQIITENASLQQYGPNQIITENASLQQYGPNQIITENASLQQYRPNQIITENASLQLYGPNQIITEKGNLQQYRQDRIPTDAEFKTVSSNKVLSDDGTMNQRLYQNVIGKPLEMFDYNHGLPPINTNKNSDISSPRNMSDEPFVARRDLQRQLMASLIVQEYPPSNEVDKLDCSECDRIDLSHLENFDTPTQLNTSIPAETVSCSKSFNYQSNYVPEYKSQVNDVQCKDKEIKTVSYQEPLATLTYEADKGNNFVLESRYKNISQPSARLDSYQDIIETQHENARRKTPCKELNSVSNDHTQMANNKTETYLNPHLQRISLRPNCFASNDKGTGVENYTKKQYVEDDLREATRRYLQNSEELPRFVSNTSRNPIQKRTIGLAQPLQREKAIDEHQQRGKGVPKWTHEEKRKMQQSPWATADSPPMDLDYEDSPINTALNPHGYTSEYSNRSVFTGQTPQKKIKLTYQRMPGKKGQTKLVFR